MSDFPAEQASTEEFSAIDTRWSLVFLAHRGTVTAAGPARNELVLRYRCAIQSYIRAMMCDDNAADEVAQDVVLRLLSGDFAGATPDKGRFRNYLKVAVRNLVRSYWRDSKRRACEPLVGDRFVDGRESDEADALWNYDWRSAVLQAAWNALRQYERETPGNVFYTLLRLRSRFPEFRSTQLSARLKVLTGKTLKPANLRQQLHRARFRFAQFVVEELARGLDWPLPVEVEQELIDLGLLKYVRDFLPADWKQTGILHERLSPGWVPV